MTPHRVIKIIKYNKQVNMTKTRVNVQHTTFVYGVKHRHKVNFESMVDNDRGSLCGKRLVLKYRLHSYCNIYVTLFTF